MIGFLQGQVLEKNENHLLLGVISGTQSAASQVGYLVHVPQNSAYSNYEVGHPLSLYIHTHVREDALDLYGFASTFEKTVFLTLLSVKGIGPKSALGILSGVDPGELVDAIAREDEKFLSKIPGIGKKTAERVVVELKDVVGKRLSPAQRPVASAAQVRGSIASSHLLEDAKQALLGLGYREQDVQPLLKRILANEEDSAQPKKVEEVVRQALRQLTF